MTYREELLTLTGQVLNGMLSADDSVLSKIFDRTIHKQVAETAVNIAADSIECINKKHEEFLHGE
jgi:hypothetical protein